MEWLCQPIFYVLFFGDIVLSTEQWCILHQRLLSDSVLAQHSYFWIVGCHRPQPCRELPSLPTSSDSIEREQSAEEDDSMPWVLLLLLAALADGLATTSNGRCHVLPDGRRLNIVKDEAAVANFIEERVYELAKAAIDSKGAFSLSIGSGTTVTPLLELKDRQLDFSKVHLFFGNERTNEGDQAGKCMNAAADFISVCGITNIYPVPKISAEMAALQYSAMIRDVSKDIVGVCPRNGIPSYDLVLLGSGADGHCASLYPDSPQVVCSPGSDHFYLPAEGKGGITLSLDAIMSARHVLLSAGKASQADMVRKCLGWSNASTNTKFPAGMIAALPGTTVEWLVTEASAVELPAL